MKAIVYTQYGSPEVLQLKEVEKPIPKDDEVLIKVEAASINASDWEFLRGSPLYTRFWGPLKPRHPILGSDVAGRIETVGKAVTKFQVGDAVFGDILEYWGGFAEYVCAPERALNVKPDAITFSMAAAIPQAACVALQGLRDKGQIRSGQRVLINGAGGGAGSFAIQFAKYYGAEVTGVDHAHKLDFMHAIGADHVIDYRLEDFTRNGLQYNLILDFVAHHSMIDYRRALSPWGVYVMVGGSLSHLFQTLVFGAWFNLVGSKRMGILAAKQNKDVAFILDLIVAGKISPVIDKEYPLANTPEALENLGAGNAKGKVIIRVGAL